MVGWYAYNSNPAPASSFFLDNTPSQAILGNSLTMFFSIDAKNIISFVIHVSHHNDGQAGELELQLDSANLDPRGGQLRVQDDPANYVGATDSRDTFIWNNGQGTFRFKWGASSSDGAVLSPIVVVGNSKATCFQPRVISRQNVTNWKVIYWNTQTNSFQTVNLGWDETPSICTYDCRNSCFLHSDCVSCATDTTCTWCESSKRCLQNIDADVATCNEKYVDSCPCRFSNSSCTECLSNPTQCGWCCNAEGPTCLEGNLGGPTNGATCGSWNAQTCPTGGCNPPCLRGSCVCGKCECPRTFGGDDCSLIEGCDGIIGSEKVVDVCGECGGDGTKCLGCDGIPFGKTYDICGVCGGDGSTCWSRCPFRDCSRCNSAEDCLWCGNKGNGDGQCIQTTGDVTCAAPFEPVLDCSSFQIGVAEAVGLSVGIIVLIVGLVVLCLVLSGVGGKLGYDYMIKHRQGMASAQTNPLYNNDGREGTNPMYEEK